MEATEEIRQKLRDILAKIPTAEKKGFDPDAWFQTALPQQGVSPTDIVERVDRGGVVRLKMRLTAIIEMISGEDGRFLALAGGAHGGPKQLHPLANDLLGLPLSEEYRRQAQLRETLAREIRGAEAKARIERIEHHARVVLEHESRTWLSQATPELKGETPLEAASRGSAGLAQVIDILEREGEKRKAAARYRSELEKAATMRLGPGRAQLFLMAGHPALERTKPWDYCVDSESLSRCLSLLSGPRK